MILKNNNERIFELMVIGCMLEDTGIIGKDMIVVFCVKQNKMNF